MLLLLGIVAAVDVVAGSRDYAPHNFTQLPPSPTVASLDGGMDIGVSYATGQPDINIPIYEVRQGTLAIPISIAYHGGGIKVDETAGIVGLGWTLNAGASIARTVNGLPDEMLEEGGAMRGLLHIDANGRKLRDYVRQKPAEYDNSIAGSEYVRFISQYCQPYEDGRMDVANDVLRLSGLGLDCTFAYDDNRRMVLQSNVFLDFRNGRQLQSAFPNRYEVVDGNGTCYCFQEVEQSEYEYLYYPNIQQNPDLQKSKFRFASAWHLTKIKSMQGDSIVFEYQDAGRRRYKIGGTYRYEDCFDSDYIRRLTCGLTGADSYIDYYPKLLKRIVSSSETIEFKYETKSVSLSAFSTRYDRLLQIVVHRGDDKSTVVKRFEFTQTQSPFGGKYGGLLTQVDRLSANGKERQMLYSFNYQDGEVPASYGNSQDHWGYYNGADNKTLLTDDFGHPSGSYPKGDRRPQEAQTMIGMLRRINYPTGGFTSLDWEQHDYGYVNSLKNKEQVTTTVTPRNYTLCGRKPAEKTVQPISLETRTTVTVDVSKYFGMFDALGYLGGDDGWKDYNNTHTPLYSDYYPSVKILDGNSNVVGMVFIDRENSASPHKIALGAGAYRIMLYNPRNIDLPNLESYFERENAEGDFGIVSIAFDEVKETRSDPRRSWGGLRIKAVSSFTNDETNASLRRTFKYCDAYADSLSSSGVVPMEPEYSYHFIFGGHDDGGLGDNIATVYGTSSVGLAGAAAGYSGILYHRVFETRETESGDIVTQYDFSTFRDSPDVLDMAFSNCGPVNNRIPTSRAYKRGDLVSKTVFSPSDRLLRRQYDYQYSVVEAPVGSLTGDFVKISDFSNLMLKDSVDLLADYTVSKYSLTVCAKRIATATVTETSATGATSVRTVGSSYFSDQSPEGNLCRLKKSEWTVNSCGQKEETFFTYIKGNCNLVVSEVTVCEGTIISAKRREYDDRGRIVRTFTGEAGVKALDKYRLGEIFISDELKDYISIPGFEYAYDHCGNIAQISYKGRVLASYLWAYGGRYPVVEALGTDYATLLDKAGVEGGALSRLSDDAALKEVFKSIRQGLPDSDITTTTYQWLTGMAEVTDSSGVTTAYTYDSLGRLEGVKDANQYYIKKFEYQYR